MSIYSFLLLCLIAVAVDSQENATVNTVCFDGLGCLDFKPNSNEEPVVSITSFTLYTRKNLEEGQILEVNSNETITKSNFQPKKPTKLIIHGFVSDAESEWMITMKNELLKNSNSNVILVRWPSWTDYITAKRRIQVVGQEVASLINTLGELVGLDLKNVHLIGHSLGAHTAGFAGKKLQGQVGRITGLDPAGPGYVKVPSTKRLHHTDAQFVDVIHTGATKIFGYGITVPCGHVDFYPNGGKKQPGCVPSNKNDIIGKMGELGCDHSRVQELFTESINSNCLFVANKCDSYDEYLQGNCFSNDVTDLNIMGLKAKQSSSPPGTKYFLITGDAPPYCRQQYKVTMNLDKPLGFVLNDNDSLNNSTETTLVISLPVNQ
ncbi:pancreatic lipase-related protein 2-like isoform X2 [Adelges cooleyi]|uniref:pancreatic lipase-related protein 2-like isoform X2 n=1 Tax=Adelges cooleyi TaxID=133065 RepID=UPI00217F2E6E|nr:pancreatic lipase-related protein 2-like isoform X2 [Adelges cooleyi]